MEFQTRTYISEQMPMMISNGRFSDPSFTMDLIRGSTVSSEVVIDRLVDDLQEEDAAMRSTTTAQMQVMHELVALKRQLKQKQTALMETNAELKQVYKQEHSSSKTDGGGARHKNSQVPHIPRLEENVSTSLEQRAHELIAYAGGLLSHGEQYMQQDVGWAARLAAMGHPPPVQENSFAGADESTLHPAVRQPRMLQETWCTAPDEASVSVPQWHGLHSKTPPTSSIASS